MYGKVSDISPKLYFIESGDFFGNTRLWGRHILYNSHELYLLGQKSSGGPPIGSIEDKTPTLYSVVNE